MLKQIVGLTTIKKVRMLHFQDAVVEFRNKKIGHGSLSLPEAEQLRPPLEAALTQWLGLLPTLSERYLLHIAECKWKAPQFQYAGIRLNMSPTWP